MSESRTDEVIKLLTRIANATEKIARGMTSSNGNPPADDIATDGQLDGRNGDPVVKFNPNKWTGGDHKGLNFSGCSPEFLDMLAGSYDYFARKNDESGAMTDQGKPKGDFDRYSARLARGWAKRIRAGGGAQPQEPRPMAAEGAGDPFLENTWPEDDEDAAV